MKVKEALIVNLINLPLKTTRHARFTTLPFALSSEQYCAGYIRFSRSMRKSVCRETTIQNEQFLKEIDGNIILVQTRLHLVYWSTPGVYIFIMIYGDLGKYMKNWTSKSFSVSFILVYLLIKIIYFSNSAKKVLKTFYSTICKRGLGE